MIIGIGTDIIQIHRISESIEKYGTRFLNRIYTETEINYSSGFKEAQALHFAARFAAKEAFSKAIGTGITEGFKFKEIGIKNEINGKPEVELFGLLLERWGNYKTHISLSHTNRDAIAFCVIEIQ